MKRTINLPRHSPHGWNCAFGKISSCDATADRVVVIAHEGEGGWVWEGTVAQYEAAWDVD